MRVQLPPWEQYKDTACTCLFLIVGLLWILFLTQLWALANIIPWQSSDCYSAQQDLRSCREFLIKCVHWPLIPTDDPLDE